jgi:DNA-binding PadR family transcriptional regulator
VLGLLSFGEELSGYDLKKWADHSLHLFFWSPAISHIYRELKRLHELGYVAVREVAQDELRNKRVFRITENGLALLARWVEEALLEPPVLKDHVLLRVWLGHVTEKERILDLVAHEEDESRRMIEDVERNIAIARRNPDRPYPVLVEQWCLRYARARLDAFAELRRTLDSTPVPGPGARVGRRTGMAQPG